MRYKYVTLQLKLHLLKKKNKPKQSISSEGDLEIGGLLCDHQIIPFSGLVSEVPLQI